MASNLTFFRRRPVVSAALLTLAGLVAAFSPGSNAALAPEASVSVDLTQKQGSVSPTLLGQNTDWQGTGVWDPAAAAPVATTKGLLQQLQVPLMRFPGGLLANSYLWSQGVGPVANRPAQAVNSAGNSQVDAFGTDEFMQYVSDLGGQALITVDVCGAARPYSGCHQPGSSDITPNCPAPPGNCPGANDAANWVRYLNDTQYASSTGGWRARNGHAAPYGVRYFELGNEVFDLSPSQYSAVVSAYSAAMKRADPWIQLAAVVQEDGAGHGPWVDAMTALPAHTIDFLAPHFYVPNEDNHTALFNASSTVRNYSFSVANPGSGAMVLVVTGHPSARVHVVVDGGVVGDLTPTGQCYDCTIGGTGATAQWMGVTLSAGSHSLQMSCGQCGGQVNAQVLAAYNRDAGNRWTSIPLNPVNGATFEKVVYSSVILIWNHLTGLNAAISASGKPLSLLPSEWSTSYGQVENWANQIEDQASTVYEAALIQAMMRQHVAGAAFWQINSWHFHVVHTDTATYALPGQLFKMLAGHIDSTMVGTSVSAPTFSVPATDTMPAASKISEVLPVATADGNQANIQLVNFADHPVTTSVNIVGGVPAGQASLTSLTAPTAWTVDDASNSSPSAPATTSMMAASTMTVTLPARSASVLAVPLA
jgi:alpha-L-arabinofuranosidase